MSSCSNAQSIEAVVPVSENVSEQNESNLRCEEEVDDEDEDEDEDVDFNPFLKGPASPEASSSLSSEVEGLDGEVVDSGINVDASSAGGEEKACVAEDGEEEEEELVMESEKVVENNECGKLDSGVEAVREKDDDDGSGMGDDAVSKGETGKCAIDVDDEGEDAICKRTRARYSLASFTLDELETFLQETDDDDDLQNVDDEEEYRKFLTAVLYGREGDGELTKENGNAADDDDDDDEDEENDADFELELEELLDSDVDMDARDKNIEYEGGGRRPKTRQNRKTSGRSKKNLGQRKRSLPPLLPVLPMGSVSTFYTHDICTSVPGTSSNGLSSKNNDRSMSGFTAHQIGQLHHLIYEHVQLLIQVYSLCVLDHSRQHVASQVQKLISEMLHKRGETLVWKNIPYPNDCFCPSVPTRAPISDPTQNTSASFITSGADAASAPLNSQMLVSPNVSTFWVPSISGPVLSVLDVAPLRFIGRYMEEIDSAVQRNKRRYTETISDFSVEKVPLFPLHNFPLCVQGNSNVASGMGSAAVNVDPSSPGQHKKSLAAAIVESTKQTVALVPKEIANITQRFLPLFNPALFPHKPPVAAVINRVLFTDAEDELLALGLMEYNTDWKAIQQRFLPTKSKHQIFVRQKNRCSSKAPENPIKAVRRMKTSPLTAQEISRIQEGLKAYKGDLMAVWSFVVPHRDPTLLPRQWRTAIGIQKSYKLDEAKKEKRRLYDSKRRERKKADMPCVQSSIEKEDCQAEKSGGENNSADVQTDNAAETYVHEAFLADWRPGTSSGERTLPSGIIREANNEWIHDYRHKNAPHSQIGDMRRLLSVSKHPQNLYSHMTAVGQFASGTMKPNQPVSHMTGRTFGSQPRLPPYRARRSTGAHLVKLAPDLPPVNLPRSVRVVSQSAFRKYVRGASYAAGSGGGFRAVTKENIVSQGGKCGTINATTISQDTSHYQETLVTSFPPKESQGFKNSCIVEGGDTDSEILKEKSIEGGGDTDSDLHMHPLLFQATEDGRLPYYSLNGSTSSSSSYSFLSGNQPQLHLTLSHTPHRGTQVDGFVRSQKKSNVISRGIDFHPLMQRTDYGNNVTVTTCSTAPLSDGSAGNCNPVRHSSDSLQTELQANRDQDPTGTKSFSPYNAANELDLEIHLSSTSIKEKDLNSTDVNQQSLVKARTAGRPFYKHDESSGANRVDFVSVGDRLAIPEEMFDQSQPDIEMEQEELSDSDEESEENVEFECEEMADSEGEEDGSACEQISEMQNKDVSSNATKRPAMAERDDNIQIHRIPSLELGLSNQGMDDASNCSWLSLDTYRAEREESEDVAVKELASSRPARSCKKPGPISRENAKKNALDMAQQLSLGPLAPPPVRKPRKRVCRPNLNIALTVENYNSDS